ncbi:MAG: SET domain-containing protein-lysine N-methyltransferase [Saprospiraceae bacterium]|nr:SET domain-containing protein-lysine N-methyltransferase [Saprospiraceae bacterium]
MLGLYIAKGIQGRGVYCQKDIVKGSPIEFCPIILIPKNEVEIIHNTEIHDYYFIWGKNDEEAAIALGYGSLYNHSYKPNADFILDLSNNTINFFAIKNIKAGKEITINYHGQPENRDELWFDKSGKRIKRIKYTP